MLSLLCVSCNWTPAFPMMCSWATQVHPSNVSLHLIGDKSTINSSIEGILKVLTKKLLCKYIITCFMLLENKNISWRTGLRQNDNYSVTCILWDTYLFWKRGECNLIDTFACNGCFLFKCSPSWGKNWNAAQDVKYWCCIIQTRKLWYVSLLFNHAKSRSAQGINDRTIELLCI